MNKVIYVLLVFATLFLFSGIATSSVLVEAPANVTMSPDSIRALEITILNQENPAKNITLNVESNLDVNPKTASFLLSGWDSKTIALQIKSRKQLGYFPLKLEIAGENYTKTVIVRVSQIPFQLKKLIEYYETRISVLKGNLNESNTNLGLLVFDAEKILDNAKKDYVSENYQKTYDKLELVRNTLNQIENNVLDSKKRTAEFEKKQKDSFSKSRKRSAAIIYSLKDFSYVVITILSLITLYFIFGKKKFIIRKRKINTEHIEKVKEHFEKEKTSKKGETEEKLGKEIEELEDQLKNIAQKKGLRELEIELNLIKEKYDSGLYEMCQEYLDSFKKKLEKVGK